MTTSLLGCAVATSLAASPFPRTPRKHAAPPPAMTPWQHALAERAKLEANPHPTPADYTHLIAEFRAVYYGNPRDPHAAEAVDAVAELFGEQSKALHNPRAAKLATRQYEFLRTQYPGSSFAHAAKAKEAALTASPDNRKRDGTAKNGVAAEAAPAPPARREETALEGAPPLPVPLPAKTNIRHAGPPAMVNGVRHWSTPTYTRVAIDLGDAVTFEAARVAHPDRIYFDLHGAKLGAELVGKTFDVTDDGFLKKIRGAQISNDLTRIVLDVSDVSDYSAFLLPNPYRLIIDIHGRKPEAAAATHAPPVETAESSMPLPANADRKANAAANISGLPPTAPTDGGEMVRPASAPAPAVAVANAAATPSSTTRYTARSPRVATLPAAKPVPNSVTSKAPDATVEVAAISSQPGKVEASSAPSSRVIVARGREATSGKSHDHSADSAAPAKAAAKTADGQTSMIRALGLGIGRIVIDAGHGGHDSGTLGVDGIQEKDVVLDVALRLGKALHERLGAEIIYTRSDDTFIPLETRTAIANKAQADLFLSIHANSSQDESARGVETYYLNFTSSADALDVAARENAVSGQSIHQLSDLVKKITLKDKIAESREFAADVEGALYAGLQKGNTGLKDRGVKKAPFVVLIGANMPSILAEISFVTNGRDAAQLRTPEYRQRVAESLYAGVAKYESSLAGAKSQGGLRAAAQ